MTLSTQRFLVAGLSVLGLASLTACGDSTSSSGGSGFVQTCWNGSTVTVPDTAMAYGDLCPAYKGSVATLSVPAASDITVMSLPAPASLLDGTSGGENVVFTPVTAGLPTVTAKLAATASGKRDLTFDTDTLVYGEKYNYVVNFKPVNAPAFATQPASIAMPNCSDKGADHQMIGSWCAKVSVPTATNPLIIAGTGLPKDTVVVNVSAPVDATSVNIVTDIKLKAAVESDQLAFASVANASGAKIFFPVHKSIRGVYSTSTTTGTTTSSSANATVGWVIDPAVAANTLQSTDYASVTAKMPTFVLIPLSAKRAATINRIQAPKLSTPAQQIYVDLFDTGKPTCVTLTPGAAPVQSAMGCAAL